MNYIDLVNSLRKPVDYKKICNDENDILKKCILCKKYLSSNQWGILLENFIREHFLLDKSNNKTSGDAKSKDKTFEIKVSLGDIKGQLSFVQLRPDHKIDYYIFLTYNLFDDKLGKIYWFLCKSNDLYDLLPEFGQYAHGTTEKLGEITIDNIYNQNHEYALRLNPTKKDKTKTKKLWNIFIEKFLTNEDNIRKII